MAQKELTRLAVHEKLARRVGYVAKFSWLMKFNLLVFLGGFFVSLYTGEFTIALLSLFVLVVTLLTIMQQSQYRLILKLVPEPETDERNS
ncbi:MAG: hypothetical protein HQ559_02960 [Lentisphaerae bacterium]|nr:hypothetical protein [Lentisphaerota bacterium]